MDGEVAAQRIDQMQDPELNFDQAYADYRRLGYSDKWINQRLRSIEGRKELTDEWDRSGVKKGFRKDITNYFVSLCAKQPFPKWLFRMNKNERI